MRKVFFKMVAGLVMVSAFTLTGVGAQQMGAKLDRDLQAVIEKEYPGAIVPTNYDVEPCPVPKHHPAWIKADFNGDGRPDHAVLMLIENKEGIGMGRRYDSILMVFLQENPGVYRSIPVYKLAESVGEGPDPGNKKSLMLTGTYIENQPAGTIKGLGKEGNRTVKLINPGILVVLCEKWNYLWYWDAQEAKFKEVYGED